MQVYILILPTKRVTTRKLDIKTNPGNVDMGDANLGDTGQVEKPTGKTNPGNVGMGDANLGDTIQVENPTGKINAGS
ncbi:MAG: hypothetical protein K0U59_02550 [Gammaproteobacteria bacterium]|nr:hypothetical protein [Gammaproteobacteria bacterium]